MSTMLLRNVLLLAALGGSALASIGPVTDLHIVNKVISPDGFSRDSVLAEGTFPGPLIKGNKGDNFQINVIDQLVNETLLTATSIHWHGLFQHTTAWADGPAFVTQCPITANHSFLYNFTVPDQAGTFWYHSHFATQYCDGLRGPLVVYDPEDPHKDLYDIDDDSTVITLGDWYHIPAVDQGVIPTTADSTLINGLGRWPEDPTSELAVIEVKHGKRYRFRLVNVACESFYNFTIDGHDMTVIEADGINTEPRKADFLSIFVGQRYSFVLEANQPVDNYWIHADPNRGNTTGFANGINSAILRYKGAPIEEPTSNQTAPAAPLHEFDLHPLDNAPAPGQPFPGGVDFALNLALGTNDNQTLFTVNGAIYQSPSVPILLQILSGNSNAQDLLPAGSIYGLPSNSTIEISIPGGLVVGPHPFHLHGHAFSVVRSAGSTEYNYENPIRRDVVSIGDSTDNVTIRFVTDNPGPWFLHCHIDWHLRDGLAVVFAEDTPNIQATNPAPDAWKQLCPIYDASISGSN